MNTEDEHSDTEKTDTPEYHTWTHKGPQPEIHQQRNNGTKATVPVYMYKCVPPILIQQQQQ